MSKNIESLLKKAQEILNSNEDYSEYKLEYALINKQDWRKSEVFAANYDEAVTITPYANKDRIQNEPDWAYSFDDNVFFQLENEFDIGYMTLDSHYSIWCSLDELYPEEVENKKGVQNYLKYCDKNGITKKVIDEHSGHDVPDVIKFYEKKSNNREER